MTWNAPTLDSDRRTRIARPIEGKMRGLAPEPPTKSELTRQRILDAAAAVFRSQGYSGARLAEIARHAGMQTGSLHAHFASREALADEVLHTGVAVARQHVGAALAALSPSTTALDQLVAAIRAHAEAALSISDYTAAATRIVNEVPADVRRRHLVERGNDDERWEALLRAAVRAGQLRADLDLAIVQVLIVGSLAAAAESYRPMSGRSMRSIVDACLAVLMNGLAAPASSHSAGGLKPRMMRRR